MITLTQKKWSDFFKDPVFGRTFYVDGVPQQVEIYQFPGLPFWFIQLVLDHECGHLKGIKGCKRWYCLMFEGGDTLWEKFTFPCLLVHRLFTGSWYCKEHK